jgi:hypothetical protein
MSAIKVFVNGGTLLPGDLNAIATDYGGAYEYKKHLLAQSTLLQEPGAATYLLGAGSPNVIHTAELAGLAAFYLNPADYKESAVNERTVKLNLQATCVTNAVAPAVTFTVGLYPVSGSAGAEKKVELTLGSVVSGSTAAFTTPAKEVQVEQASGLFTCPSAGLYAVAVVVSGSAAAKSAVAVRANLQMSQV